MLHFETSEFGEVGGVLNIIFKSPFLNSFHYLENHCVCEVTKTRGKEGCKRELVVNVVLWNDPGEDVMRNVNEESNQIYWNH